MYVPLDGHSVAVIQVQPERLRLELVDEAPARLHRFKSTIHVRRMDSVKMNAVGVASLVRESDPDAVALGASNRRTRYLTVVGPRRVEHTWRYLDFPVLGHKLVFPEHLT